MRTKINKYIDQLYIDLSKLKSKISKAGDITEDSPEYEYIMYNIKHAGYLIEDILEEWGGSVYPSFEVVEVDCDES